VRNEAYPLFDEFANFTVTQECRLGLFQTGSRQIHTMNYVDFGFREPSGGFDFISGSR
jgi:hypothetical protein